MRFWFVSEESHGQAPAIQCPAADGRLILSADQRKKIANRLKKGNWDNVRGILNECVQIILGRPVKPDDVKFEPIPGSEYHIQVDIATASGRHRHRFQHGEASKDRNQANKNAVRAALKELGRAVGHCEEEAAAILTRRLEFHEVCNTVNEDQGRPIAAPTSSQAKESSGDASSRGDLVSFCMQHSLSNELLAKMQLEAWTSSKAAKRQGIRDSSELRELTDEARSHSLWLTIGTSCQDDLKRLCDGLMGDKLRLKKVIRDLQGQENC